MPDYRRRPLGFFTTVEEFVTPLIDRLYPDSNKTVAEKFNSLGRVRVALGMMYGEEQLKKFIELADKTSFDYVINILIDKNVKTKGRFSKVLEEIENSL